ncbi:MAG: Asp-tRNA(Asn)/Glu-tRNA(Gln) amidotransferase subunit GatB [Deltaproteobacteria bacterium]|nr:Asp-tRNA(Asn)/Glu-tRNA(Gln) amidotransferase subunit GatB [Deltaproteobacteria bacterium]
MNYETIIGLEVHAQLRTQSKIFCRCATEFHASENQNVCPVCMGLPGSLPVLNEKAVAFALKMAVATHCQIQPTSIFSRKNYFYPDLPKGYQISQYDKPLATAGVVEIVLENTSKKIRLHRIHMEEDAGKNVHGERYSYVNYNRAGIPLVEIVSEPDLRNAQEAAEYLRTLRSILRYLDISDGNMEEGSFRCDVNISLRPERSDRFGTKVEIKNINSFRFVENAILYEMERQRMCLEEGKRIVQETRLWDEHEGKTFSMRQKEEAHDYRYFPEPDLMPLEISAEWVSQIRSTLPEFEQVKKQRFMTQYQLTNYDAKLLVQEKSLADYFEQTVHRGGDPKLVCNWILSEVLREFEVSKVACSSLTPGHLAELICLIQKGTISGKIAKDVFEKILKQGKMPSQIVREEGLEQISDAAQLEKVIEFVVSEQGDLVKQYREGQKNKFSFLVGQIMKKTQGKANPKIVSELLKNKLEREDT